MKGNMKFNTFNKGKIRKEKLALFDASIILFYV